MGSIILSLIPTKNKKIDVFTFGSNSEHGDKFMLIDFLNDGNKHSYEFFGNLGLEQDLELLISFFKKAGHDKSNRYKKAF